MVLSAIVIPLVVWGLLIVRKHYRGYTAPADRVARQFLTEVAAGRLDAAYALTACGDENPCSQSDFRAQAAKPAAYSGPIVRIVYGRSNIVTGTEGRHIYLTYLVIGSRGREVAEIDMIPVGSGFKVAHFAYDPAPVRRR